MKFFETSKYHSFKKSTYISLRWIGILGQLIAVNFVYFFLNSEFNVITSNIIIFLGILSNLYLIYIYKKTQLSDRSAFIFLLVFAAVLAVAFAPATIPLVTLLKNNPIAGAGIYLRKKWLKV